jgi:hypothetical protein
LIWLLLCGRVAAQDGGVYIDKGACPGEGCRYGEKWTATQIVSLLGQPDPAARPVASIPAGASVQAVTGEVHTVPGRFVVHRPHGNFVPGDEVLVFTYLGEGRFRLRHNGVLKDVDLNFGPGGSSSGTRCESNELRCWGKLQDELKSDWWFKVRAESGDEGWVRGAAGFATPSAH